jgi:hypothetical protein
MSESVADVIIFSKLFLTIDRAACNSPSIDLALAFTGGGYFDYMRRRTIDFENIFTRNGSNSSNRIAKTVDMKALWLLLPLITKNPNISL